MEAGVKSHLIRWTLSPAECLVTLLWAEEARIRGRGCERGIIIGGCSHRCSPLALVLLACSMELCAFAAGVPRKEREERRVGPVCESRTILGDEVESRAIKMPDRHIRSLNIP